jgi:hypothetical protein
MSQPILQRIVPEIKSKYTKNLIRCTKFKNSNKVKSLARLMYGKLGYCNG